MADKEAPVDQPEKKTRGRPLKIQSVEELNVKIEQHFESCDTHIAKTKIRKERADGTM